MGKMRGSAGGGSSGSDTQAGGGNGVPPSQANGQKKGPRNFGHSASCPDHEHSHEHGHEHGHDHEHGHEHGSHEIDPELEALAADLERGWELIESGEQGALDEARKLAKELLKKYPDAPEVLVLLGMLDSLQGELEQALGRYEQAIELDPDYFEPLLCAAELYIWELGEDEKGLELCQRAQEVAEEEEEYLDALLLQAEAEINLSRERAALGTLRQLPDPKNVGLPEARYHVRAGRLFLDLGQVDEAAHHFEAAVEQDPTNGDGLHGLGLCAEEHDQRDQMIAYFCKVREADLREARPPWALDEARFQRLCAAALDQLPDELRKRMGNVPVIATDYPSEQLVKEGSDPRMLGLFSGVPYGDQTSVGGTPHLDAIFLFQRNIERLAYSADDVEHEIRITLAHEAGHFFGLSDEQLEAMGLG